MTTQDKQPVVNWWPAAAAADDDDATPTIGLNADVLTSGAKWLS